MAIERYEKAEAYTRLYRTPMMELFRKIVTSESSMVDVFQTL